MASLPVTSVAPLRTASLLLDADQERTPLEIATWFGAMQAQDVGSGLWSFGVRMAGSSAAEVDAAVEAGDVLRTWPMRGTVHFVPAVDARWMLELTGVRSLSGAAKRREHLGLSEADAEGAAEVLRAALQGGKRLTRSACVALLVDAGVHTQPQHGYHLLWYASQIGVTCIGPQQGSEQTFVLLDEWAPEQRSLDRDEALGELALRYFRSHGPTTRQDFAGWTGLTQGDAKRAIALAGDALATVDVDGTEMVMSAALLERSAEVLAELDPHRLVLLPGFDELVLGFKDRSHILPAEHRDAIVPGGNGVFKPTIVIGGRIVGTWARTRKRAHVDIEALPFSPLTARQRRAFEGAATRYGEHLGLEARFPTA